MTQLAELDAAAPDTIQVTVNYIKNDGTKIFTYTGGPGSTEVKNQGTPDPQLVIMHNGRLETDRFTLDGDGFRFVDHPTKMTDFFNADEIKRVYYPEMIELIKRESGARRVVVFDHTLRTADDAMRDERKIREAVHRVHNDYTEWSGPQRVRDLLPREAGELLKHRFAVVQTWRPINQPVQREPLAIADARSIGTEELIPSARIYPDRRGEVYHSTYNPRHRWYYFPNMQRNEAMVFKTFDSLKDGRARWTAHCAFDDPTSAPDAPPRESIEMRALAFF